MIYSPIITLQFVRHSKKNYLFFRLPKFKAEVRNMMLTIIPLGIINYFNRNETLRSNANPGPALSEDEDTDSVSSNENINTPQRTSVNPQRNPTK